MNKDKVGVFDFSTTILNLSGSSFFGIFSSFLLFNSKNASLISVIIGFIISLFLNKIILSFYNKLTSLSFSEKIKKIYGKYSIIINIIFVLHSIIIYMFLTYRLTSFLTSQYLVETKEVLILLLILSINYYISSKGIETLTRVSTIFFYIEIFIFLFDFISLSSQINFENFLPIINVPMKNIFISSIIFSIYFSTPTIFIYTVKKDLIYEKEKFNKYYYLMELLIFIIIFTFIFTTIGVNGINVTNLFDYPLYTVLKRINVFTFLDSIENVSIMLWILFIIDITSTIFMFINNNIKSTFNINYKYTDIIILFLIFIIEKVLFINNTYTETYEYVWAPFYINVFVLSIIFISNLIIKKNNH